MPNLTTVNYLYSEGDDAYGTSLDRNGDGISILNWALEPLNISLPQLFNTTKVAMGGSIGR
jgi:hypothetical protein